jgi:hypothetical protein
MKIGDKVKVTRNKHQGEEHLVGKVGTVREYVPDSVGVVFPGWHGGHGLETGKYTSTGGWYFDPDALRVVKPRAKKVKKSRKKS